MRAQVFPNTLIIAAVTVVLLGAKAPGDPSTSESLDAHQAISVQEFVDRIGRDFQKDGLEEVRARLKALIQAYEEGQGVPSLTHMQIYLKEFDHGGDLFNPRFYEEMLGKSNQMAFEVSWLPFESDSRPGKIDSLNAKEISTFFHETKDQENAILMLCDIVGTRTQRKITPRDSSVTITKEATINYYVLKIKDEKLEWAHDQFSPVEIRSFKFQQPFEEDDPKGTEIEKFEEDPLIVDCPAAFRTLYRKQRGIFRFGICRGFRPPKDYERRCQSDNGSFPRTDGNRKAE